MSRLQVVLIAAGVAILQLVWLFAIAPFRGIDEFDHSYRAAAVAHGQWHVQPTAATRGTGAWLRVPQDIVTAASAQCRALPYTVAADCVGTPSSDGMVRIASGAGRYNPVFYALAGLPSLILKGDAALYGMRVVSATLALLVLVAGLLSMRTWASSRWPVLAFGVALSPVLLYSTAVLAPNGVEMAAGLAAWTSLIGVIRTPNRPLNTVVAALSASVLVTVRSLGPLWLVMIVLAVVLAEMPARQWWMSYFGRRTTWIAAGLVALASVASLWWILSMRALTVGADGSPDANSLDRLKIVGGQIPLWLLQSVAAFPLRNEASAPTVYLVYFFALLTVLGLGVSQMPIRVRVVTIGAIATAIIIAGGITFATYNDYGGAWQGRYLLPFLVGIPLLAAAHLDGDIPEVIRNLASMLVPAALAIAQVAAVVLAAHRQLAHDAVDPARWIPPLPVIGIVAAFGCAALVAGTAPWPRSDRTAA
ncbi:DUF2142 domain-containing protein [Nocardioides sp. Kera G14]|uniref:DUF2142 domain-containing protein n=1 Tax=Nocardioides sp. Kera G14 TaxID=2884264 RepID=UPI001D118137|nr:DUF2142 domain-containing protein [Nocardioides sp. Kera G14]UDY22536.1 DUF2142 domain-containing protein [Nocardioides sp. Kera G14]